MDEGLSRTLIRLGIVLACMTSLTRAWPWAVAKVAKFVAYDFVVVGGFVKSDGRCIWLA